MHFPLVSASILNLSHALRIAVVAGTLSVLPAVASAREAAPADRAAQLLAEAGRIPVQTAGPYVGPGTYRIQVSVKLGRPEVVLSDGTWLYPNYTVDGSSARGTLVVRFNDAGRVSKLVLVTPAVALAMNAPKNAPGKTLVAAGQ